MPCDIEQLKRFPAQIKKIGKIEQGRSANNDIDSNIATDGGTKMDGKDVVEKKRFKNISKQYNKKENNIHNVQNNGKKNKGTKKRINKIVEKKKKNAREKKL